MRHALMALACGLIATGCGGTGDDATPGDTTTPAGTAITDTGMTSSSQATAALRDSAGVDIGTLTLTDAVGGIVVAGTLRGLPPGEHAIHVHMTGQCEPPFESAGGHWNPTSRQHGSENAAGQHFGDMRNITVGADSTVSVEVTTPGGTLRGENALMDGDGGAVVVHAGADDYRTDPTGAAGARIACGVVTAS